MAEGNPTEWIESNEHGLVREMRATLPDDSVLWFHNAETLGHGLDLVDKYNLKGVGMFITGCEDLAVWP